MSSSSEERVNGERLGGDTGEVRSVLAGRVVCQISFDSRFCFDVEATGVVIDEESLLRCGTDV